MTDREMVELAAKAAGMDLSQYYWNANASGFTMIPELGGNWEEWSPLIDDGDALRLAVKLGLIGDSGLAWEFMEAAGDCAATRRAIVRAAALAGTNLPEAAPENAEDGVKVPTNHAAARANAGY